MNGKMSQILNIDPARELVFRGPFTDVSNAQLTLTNPSDRRVCFKVKTTAPKQYCVRPNSGVIRSKETKAITVMLQPLEGGTDTNSKHKFMVQSCYAPGPDDADVDLETIWKIVDPSELMCSKLMVVFEQQRSNTILASEEAPATVQYSSPSGSINASSVSAGKDDWESKYRMLSASVKKIEDDKSTLQREVNDLFKKNAKLQQDLQTGSDIGVPTLQVILLAIAGLLIGLIIGKLF